MPKPFVPLTLAQFRELLNKFPFTRKVNVVHMHHTWRPNHSQYRGVATIEAMFDFHTRERKFSDIAQHITIAPDGTIWTGRNWNHAPASAVGHNGNQDFGPFMFETIGDFDTGKDAFEDPQRETVLQVIAAMQQRFGLAPEALRFHNQMSDKTCPGSSIDFRSTVEEVRRRHGQSRSDDARSESSAPRSGGQPPFSPSFRDDDLTGVDRDTIESALRALTPASSRAAAAESRDTELPEATEEVQFTSTGSMTSAASRDVSVTSTDLVALRPHVIDLKEGQLTRGGGLFTLPEDVERIFGEDMERAFQSPQSMGMPHRNPTEPFRIMLWAHGGLISEKAGLAIAQKHLQFWKENGIYPVYFVWETGLLQTIGQLLRGLLPGGARGFADAVTDPILERVARAAGGGKIWAGMKHNAGLASGAEGGATFCATELKKFCDRHPGQIELHAAGHSAGSIFHAHFLPAAFAAGIPTVKALHLLAPAIRVDTFKDKLLKLVGNEIQQLALFTMVKEKELADHCAGIYRKSLLYLIRFALEQEQDAEILGLEECLRRDRAVASLFGLGGFPAGSAEAVFSPSTASDGVIATRSTTHGGFDDDPITMNSVAMRTLGVQLKRDLRKPYQETGVRDLPEDPWTIPEVVELHRSFASAVLPPSPPGPAATPILPHRRPPSPHTTGGVAPSLPSPSSGGLRRALCVGIDRYPIKPLAGCVADAKLWASTLQSLHFDCEMLLDADATYTNIRNQLSALVKSGRPGDVLVWQYAGHGTQVPDLNGDEKDGDSPGRDEAICPVDLQSGRFFIDDEIGELIDQLQPGVSFTMFIDCCHSGTINRFGFGEPPNPSTIRDERARFIPLTDDLKQAYLQFAAAQGGSRAFTASRTRDAVKQTNEVLFSACLSTEVAWESNGQGEFTLRATRLLSERGLSVTNAEFMSEVIAAFGPSPRQTPNLTCADHLRNVSILAPMTGAGGRGLAVSGNAASVAEAGRFNALAEALDATARALRQL